MNADEVYGEYLRSTAEPQPAPPIIDPADALGEQSFIGPEPVQDKPVQDGKPGVLSEFGDFAGTVLKTVGDLPDAAVRGGLMGGAEGAYAIGLIDDDQITRFRTFMKGASDLAVAEGVEPITASLVEAFGQMAPSALPVFKGLQLAGVARPLAALVAEAVGGAFGFNPDDPNLANLVQDNVDQGELLSVVTKLMATDPNDPDAINRIRNGIQDLTIGGIFEGLVWGVPKAVRRFKEGKSPVPVGMSIEDVSGKLKSAAPTKLPSLHSDIPSDEWLQGKVDYSTTKGANEYGVPFMGTVTGSYSSKVMLPVSVLRDIKGMRREQSNIRPDDLDWLKNEMGKTGQLPEGLAGKEYAPFIQVDKDGVPWVNEGNHRIMAAAELGWETMPVEIRYFDGGELKDGVLSPDKVLQHTQDGIAGAAKLKTDTPHLQGTLTIGTARRATPKEMQAATLNELPRDVTAPDANLPEVFTMPYKVQPSVGGLRTAFKTAIDKFNTLDEAGQVAMAQEADEVIARFIGKYPSKKGHQSLLTQNMKLVKTEKGYEGGKPIVLPDGRNIDNTGLALSPAFKANKFTTCPNSASCAGSCLGKTSGGYFFMGGGSDLSAVKGPRLESVKKTLAMLHEPEAFAIKLNNDIRIAKIKARKEGRMLAIRLNVLSDINPQIHEAIIKDNPDVMFYDYTKNNTNPIAANHHYTYSSTGVTQMVDGKKVINNHTNWKQMRKRLDGGDNVAMAFSDKTVLPKTVVDEETGKVYAVVNGDTHDYRPMDATPEGTDGVIIGLKNKDKGKKQSAAVADSGGFFVHYDPDFKREGKKLVKDADGDPIPQNDVVTIVKQTRNPKTLTNDGKAQGRNDELVLSTIESPQEIIDRIRQPYKEFTAEGVEEVVTIETRRVGNVIEISKITTPEKLRGTGLAEKELQALINKADTEGITLALTPSDAFGASKSRLTKWYKRHGFVPNRGRNKDFTTKEALIRPAELPPLGG